MKNKKLLIALLALCAVNFAAHLVFYPALPETVPIHWGFDGQADGWGSKASVLVMAALPAGMVLLMALIPKIDPHAGNFEKFQPVYRIFLIALTVFLCGVSWLSELTVYDVLPAAGGSLVSALVLGGCGVLFVVLGNYMPRIKQNYTFGCRTPWALSDEHNWNRTQRMGGIVFVVIGIAMLLAAVFARLLGEGGTLAVLLVPLFGGCIWIYVYSYLVFIGKMK